MHHQFWLYLDIFKFNVIDIYSSSDEVVNKAKTILEEYNKMKNVLKLITVDSRTIKPEEIEERKEKLFALKHFGSKIKDAVLLKENEIKNDVSYKEVKLIKEYFKKFTN